MSQNSQENEKKLSTEEHTESRADKASDTQKRSIWLSNYLPPLALFAVSLILFLNLNPSDVAPRTTLYFDASHYLETTRRLFETISIAISGHLSTGQLDALAFYLMLDGPVLPGAAVLAFWLSQKAPDPANWLVLVQMQCVIQAACTVMIYLLALRLLKRKVIALVCALVWATYPSAITACNTFLTEPLTCLLSVSLVYFLSFLFERNPDAQIQSDGRQMQKKFPLRAVCGLLSGICWALLCLLKPALFPGASLVFFIALIGSIFKPKIVIDKSLQAPRAKELGRRSLDSVLAISGALIVIVPWLVFGMLAHGQMQLLPSRRPVYNITTGCNIEGDGWGCYPTHPVALMYPEEEPASHVAVAMAKHDINEFSNMVLRKCTRLWNLPWNDYRYKILGLNYRLQSIYQLLLVLSGFAGLLAVLTQLERRTFTSRESFIAGAILIMVVCHFIYLPFESISRYGFTAMPFILIAGAFLFQKAGQRRSGMLNILLLLCAFSYTISSCRLDPFPFLLFLSPNIDLANAIQACLRAVSALLIIAATYRALDLGKEEQKAKTLFFLASGAILILSIAICAAFALSKNETHIWTSRLGADSIATRSVEIQKLGKPAWALILVDGDEHISRTKVSVNGKPIGSPLVSIYQFDTEHYDLEDWLNQFASLVRQSPESIGRWRAVPVPVEDLKEGWNDLSVSGPPALTPNATIYGDYIQRSSYGKVVLPGFEQVSPGKFFNDSQDDFDSRVSQRTYSKVSRSRNKTTQVKLAGDEDLSPAPGIQKGDFRIVLMLGYTNNAQDNQKTALTVFPNESFEIFSDQKKDSENSFEMKQGSETAHMNSTIDVPETYARSSHLKVLIKGEIKGLSPDASLAVAGVVAGKDRFMASVLPGTPKLFKCSNAWQALELDAELPSKILKDKKSTLRVELISPAGSVKVRNLQVILIPVARPQMIGHSTRVF